MKIGIPSEILPGEQRTAMVPESVTKLVALGAEVVVEAGLGALSGIPDEAYEKAGASVESDRTKLVSNADIVLRFHPPAQEDVEQMQSGSLHIGFLNPFDKTSPVGILARKQINAIGIEMVPRITRAQRMDALTSQANLAGYVAVLIAANHTTKAFPMMMTAAGTIQPCRVLVVGAGVAGLQAIATARRLGAQVTAYDTRPVVREQVESLGARFAQIDVGETGQTDQGYAKALTDEQLAKQREAMLKFYRNADIVITTAQVFGKPAPKIVTKDIVNVMEPGTVVVDLAVETGGNVEEIQLDEIVDINGVKLIGFSKLPGRVAFHASQMYASNLVHLITEFWDKETKTWKWDLEDEIMKSCLIAYEGKIIHPQFQSIHS